jgi:transcriptional regulator with GAF, ATPase, and Fis domain
MKELQAYDWPGNVRELQNVIERAVIRARDGELDLALRPAQAAGVRHPRRADSPGLLATAPPASLHDLKQQERAFIAEALARTRGKIYGPDGAAALLGVKPTTLSSKVHRMGLKKPVQS